MKKHTWPLHVAAWADCGCIVAINPDRSRLDPVAEIDGIVIRKAIRGERGLRTRDFTCVCLARQAEIAGAFRAAREAVSA